MRTFLAYCAFLSIIGTGQARSDDFDAILVCHGERKSADGLSRSVSLKFWYDRDTAKVIGCGRKGCTTYDHVTLENGWLVLHTPAADFPTQRTADETRKLSFSQKRYHEVGYFRKKYYNRTIRYESDLKCERTADNSRNPFDR